MVISDMPGEIRIVLVSPIYAGNVGAVCRVMKNMGLRQLVIAAPRAPLDYEEARTMACHAGDVLDGRREFPTLAEAIADCGLVAGTTARPGLYRGHVRTPREWAPRLVAAAADGPVALVFGPEDNGLSTADIGRCTQLIRIPSAPEYESLNLSHAVMICCYELFLVSGRFEPPVERFPEAPAAMREALFAKWRKALLDIGFMKEDKAEHMMLGLRRILSRGPLTVADVQIMIGIAHQMQWCAARMRGETRNPAPWETGDDDGSAPE